MFRNTVDRVSTTRTIRMAVGLFFALSAAFGGEFIHHYIQLERELSIGREHLAMQVREKIAGKLARDLVNGDLSALEEALRESLESTVLDGLAVTTTTGETIATAGKAPVESPAVIVLRQPLHHEEQGGRSKSVGLLSIGFSRIEQEDSFRRQITEAAKFNAALAVATYLILLAWLRRELLSKQYAVAEPAGLTAGQGTTGISEKTAGAESNGFSPLPASLSQDLQGVEGVRSQEAFSHSAVALLLNDIPLGMLWERENAIVACSRHLEKYFGYESGELQGRHQSTLFANAHECLLIQPGGGKQPNAGLAREFEFQRKDRQVFKAFLAIVPSQACTAGKPTNVWTIFDPKLLDRIEGARSFRNAEKQKFPPPNLTGYKHSNADDVPATTMPIKETPKAGYEFQRTGSNLPASASRCPPDSGQSNRHTYETDRSPIGGREILPFDLACTMEGIAALLVDKADKKGIEIVLDIDIDTQNFLVGDAVQLGQLVNILVGRCLRQTKQREVVISIREHRRDDSSVELIFCLSGECICASPRQPCTESASPARSSEFSSGQDASFDLNVAHHMAQSMGGDLWAEDTPQKGNILCFMASFGIGGPDHSRRASYRERFKSFAGRRVLVIDDSKSSGHVIGAQLRQLGLTPDVFDSGQTALESLKKSPPADYLFCCIDGNMPGMDGKEAACALRAHYGFRTPPMLLLGRPRADWLDGENLFSAKVAKPLTLDRVYRSVASILHIAQSAVDIRKPGINGPLITRLKGKRLLLVERAESYRETIADFLREAKVDLRLASNGLEALQSVLEDTPDCILMDCHAPGMDGFEACARLRAFGYQHLPIIALTNNNPGHVRQRCLDAGMNDIISKPVDLAVLLAKVVRWTTAGDSSARPSSPAISPRMAALPCRENDEPLPPLPAGLDIERGLRRLQGNRTLFLKALRIFRDSRGHPFQLELRVAVAGQDWPTCERLAHGLKNTAAAIGANEVALAAARLETATKAGKYGEIPPLLTDLSKKLRAIVEGLADIG